MKKNMILAAAAAASTILLSLSCTKQDGIQSENGKKIFTGSIEQIQTKTVLVDQVKVNWSEGDLVNINGAVYSATPKGEGKAVFTYKEGEEIPAAQAEGKYAALYPASLYDGEGTHFPEFQIYEPGKLNVPMLAVSQTQELTFHNMCGVICFALKGSVKILGIALEADYNALCGAFEPNMTTFKAIVGSPDDTNNHVGLNCGENGVQLDAEVPTYFYIYVPETTFPAGSLHASIVGVGGSKDLETGSEVTVEANNIYTFEYTIDSFDSEESEPAHDEPAEEARILSGVFTVGPGYDGKLGTADDAKVKFFGGNLWYNASDDSWHIEEHQYDIPTSYDRNHLGTFYYFSNAENSNYGTKDISAFTIEQLHETQNIQNYGLYYDTQNPECIDEWGAAYGKGHTLSIDEWGYLLSFGEGRLDIIDDDIDYTNDIRKDRAKENVKVGERTGMVLVPDDWDLTNSPIKETYTIEEWEAAEEAGAVFLPYIITMTAGEIHHKTDQVCWYHCRDCQSEPNDEDPSITNVYYGGMTNFGSDNYEHACLIVMYEPFFLCAVRLTVPCDNNNQ